MIAIYYQVWLDGVPYRKGKRFADARGAWALRDQVAGRISERQARTRLGVYVIDESGQRPVVHEIPRS